MSKELIRLVNLKMAFDSLSIDQFEFMDEVLKNIIVTPNNLQFVQYL